MDFLHPRKRPAPPASAACTYWPRRRVCSSSSCRSSTSGTSAGRCRTRLTLYYSATGLGNQEIAGLEKVKKTVDAVDQWRSGDAVWLDELKWLSEKLPPAKEVMITNLTCRTRQQAPRSRLGVCHRPGDRSHEGARRRGHRMVHDGKLQPAQKSKEYKWEFGGTVSVGQELKAAKSSRAPRGRLPQMTLNKRERVMAIAVAVVLVVFIAWFATGEVRSPFSDLTTRARAWPTNWRRKKRIARSFRRPSSGSTRCSNSRSFRSHAGREIPTKAWLRGLVRQVNFEKPEIEQTLDEKHQEFKGFHDDLSCQGSLKQLTEFLHKFYSSGHLHLIQAACGQARREVDEPWIHDANRGDLAAGSGPQDGASKEPGKRLASADVAAYNVVAERNMFAPRLRRKWSGPRLSRNGPRPSRV